MQGLVPEPIAITPSNNAPWPAPKRMPWGWGYKRNRPPLGVGGAQPCGGQRGRHFKGGALIGLGVGAVTGFSQFILTWHLILHRTFWKSEGGGHSE